MFFEWLALLFAIEFGILPQGQFNQYNVNQTYQKNLLDLDMYLDFNARFIFFDLVYIGGDTKIFATKRSDRILDFNSTSLATVFFAGIKYNFDEDTSIDLGFRHFCQHPIVTYMYETTPSLIWEGFYEEIYIRFEGKL